MLDSLQLRIDDVPLEIDVLPDDGSTNVSGTIPATTLADRAPATRIVLEVADVIRPSDIDPDNPDQRELGLAISELLVEPATR